MIATGIVVGALTVCALWSLWQRPRGTLKYVWRQDVGTWSAATALASVGSAPAGGLMMIAFADHGVWDLWWGEAAAIVSMLAAAYWLVPRLHAAGTASLAAWLHAAGRPLAARAAAVAAIAAEAGWWLAVADQVAPWWAQSPLRTLTTASLVAGCALWPAWVGGVGALRVAALVWPLWPLLLVIVISAARRDATAAVDLALATPTPRLWSLALVLVAREWLAPSTWLVAATTARPKRTVLLAAGLRAAVLGLVLLAVATTTWTGAVAAGPVAALATAWQSGLHPVLAEAVRGAGMVWLLAALLLMAAAMWYVAANDLWAVATPQLTGTTRGLAAAVVAAACLVLANSSLGREVWRDLVEVYLGAVLPCVLAMVVLGRRIALAVPLGGAVAGIAALIARDAVEVTWAWPVWWAMAGAATLLLLRWRKLEARPNE